MRGKVALEASNTTSLTPHQISRLRSRIASEVRDLVPLAVSAVRGDITWSNSQVSLFKALLGKVIPDLSQSHATVDVNTRSVVDLSRHELEEIVARADAIDASVVDGYSGDDANDGNTREKNTKKTPAPEGARVVGDA
jgi:hypothetical protein